MNQLLLSVALNTIMDYLFALSMANKLAASGAPQPIVQQIMSDKLQSLSLVGALVAHNFVVPEVVERALASQNVPEKKRKLIATVIAAARDSYADAAKGLGVNMATVEKVRDPSDEQVEAMLAAIDDPAKSSVSFKMPAMQFEAEDKEAEEPMQVVDLTASSEPAKPSGKIDYSNES